MGSACSVQPLHTAVTHSLDCCVQLACTVLHEVLPERSNFFNAPYNELLTTPMPFAGCLNWPPTTGKLVHITCCLACGCRERSYSTSSTSPTPACLGAPLQCGRPPGTDREHIRGAYAAVYAPTQARTCHCWR
jgi:hypothetical protein